MSNQTGSRTDILGHAHLKVIGGRRTDALGAFATEILGEYSTEILGDDESGQWLHKLNPSYWFKSSAEQNMITADKRWGKANVKAQEDLVQRNKEVAAAEKAAATANAARAAQATAAEAEAKYKQLAEDVAGAFVGADEPAKDEQAKKLVLIDDARKVAKKTKNRAGDIAMKIEAGERISPEELQKLRGCLKMCKKLRSLHDQLHAETKASSTSTSGYRGADFIEPTAPSSSFLGDDESGDFVGGFGQKKWVAMVSIAATQPPAMLARYQKQHGIKLTASQTKHLSNMKALTQRKMGKQLKVAGYPVETMSGAQIGSLWSGFKKVASIAALPIAGATYLAYKGAQATGKAALWAGRKITGRSTSSAPSAAQAQASRMNAIRARRLAALKRQQAASAATVQARNEAAAAADAAQAEAAASEAEAQAQEAAAQADAPPVPPEDVYDESEGDFVGAFVGDFVGRGDFVGSAFVGAGEFVGGWVEGIEDPKAKKIVKTAATNTPAGKKIRAGATLVRSARAGNPKAKKAIVSVEAKAKTGHPQAKRDLNAIKAGNVALKTKAKAQKKVIAKKAAVARNKRGIATRKKMEAMVANKLARGTRRRQLVKIAKVEKKAAAGNPKAKAAIAKTVAKAKTGDKKAITTVNALQLVRNTRLAAKNPREKKNMKQAGALVKKGLGGNKKAIKKIRVLQAAANAGQPNAKRAVAKLKTAAALEKAVATGRVGPQPKVLSPAAVARAKKVKAARLQKIAVSTSSTREDNVAAARAAAAAGDKEGAAALMMRARERPSATTDLKNTATVAAAAQKNDPEAQDRVTRVLTKAEDGNPEAVRQAGNLAAVQTLEGIKNGRGMPPQMAEATSIVQRAQAGDPEAQRTIERAGTAAENGDKKGVTAAIALAGGAALLAATATRPAARAQLVDEAKKAQGIKLQPAEVQSRSAEFGELYAKVQNGTATRDEAERARQLAMALSKPNLAAEISALMPPFDREDPRTSLPDMPMAPILGIGDLIRESLKALTLSTRNPFQNYREGVQSRGAASMTPPMAGWAGLNDKTALLAKLASRKQGDRRAALMAKLARQRRQGL